MKIKAIEELHFTAYGDKDEARRFAMDIMGKRQADGFEDDRGGGLA